MCTINQVPIKSGVTGYKVCKTNRASYCATVDDIFSIYNGYTWKKGVNKANNDPIYSYDKTSKDIGFHCFKNKKDAMAFAIKYQGTTSFKLVLIKVSLRGDKTCPKYPTNIHRVRKGRNYIGNPFFDESPCYVAPIAIWDGKYEEIKVKEGNNYD